MAAAILDYKIQTNVTAVVQCGVVGKICPREFGAARWARTERKLIGHLQLHGSACAVDMVTVFQSISVVSISWLFEEERIALVPEKWIY